MEKMGYLRLLASLMQKILMWGGLASIVWIAFSCEEFCEEPNRTAVVIGFYNDAGESLTVAGLTVKGVGNDSTLHSKSSLAQVMLPVNPSTDTMSFVIQSDDLTADTIKINYTRHNGFISPQCGCVTYAEIREESSSTTHSITRMEIINSNVTTVTYRQGIINAENIKIYY
jgi:hypothetical protein